MDEQLAQLPDLGDGCRSAASAVFDAGGAGRIRLISSHCPARVRSGANAVGCERLLDERYTEKAYACSGLSAAFATTAMANESRKQV